MEGFFLVNKPQFVTSHDVVLQIKKKFGFSKIGHAGTLDPLANGLLIILVENVTKLSFLFTNLDKKYEGVMLFNYLYDTLDVTGTLIDIKNNVIDDEVVQKIFDKFHNKKYLQQPPIYSAIKVQGQKMYRLARKNIKIDIPKKEVFIYSLQKTSVLKNHEVNFVVHVSKGTYIRSLASDIASEINTYGVLKQLKRVAVGKYLLKDAKTINELSLNDLITIKSLFSHCQQLMLNNYLIKLVKNGIYLDHRQIVTDKSFIVKNYQNQWVAYYEIVSNNVYAPKYFFDR